MMRALTFAAVLLTALSFSAIAHAGRSCDAKKPTAQVIERGMNLAQRTAAALDASGHQVVFLARAGQNLTKYGLRYSHLGLAYRQPDGNGGHVWRVLHKLNQCGTSVSALYRHGLGDFFLDDLWRYEAVFAAPTPELQERLLALLSDDSRTVQLHHKPYSIVSYVWGQKYQQSNQWAIETFAGAAAPGVASRARAQAWLQYQGFEPTTLKIGALTRLGGRVGSANVAFDDHPNEKRYSDRIETVTVEAIFAWLARSRLGGPVQRIGWRD